MNRKQDMTSSEPSVVFPQTWLVTLGLLSAAFLLAEFTYEKKPHVHFEHWFGFYSFAAIGATFALALLGLLLRPLLWRDKEYYDG